MIPQWQVALQVARKEIQEHLRTKRLFVMAGIFLLTFILAVVIGAQIILRSRGTENALTHAEAIPTFLAFYFGVSLIGGYRFTSVLGIVLSADAIVSEWKDRTLILLLSKPASRRAILTGKILGTYAAVLLAFLAVFAIGLTAAVVFIDMPNATGWARIFGGLGIIALALFPFVAFGIMCSTLFKTTATSFVVAMALWLLAFPMLGLTGFFIAAANNLNPTTGRGLEITLAWAYLDPLNLMSAATWVLTKGQDIGAGPFTIKDVPLAILAMAGHSVVYLGISYWVVSRRDYA